jgi:hypothetical protein
VPAEKINSLVKTSFDHPLMKKIMADNLRPVQANISISIVKVIATTTKSLFQASWGRLDMKPNSNKRKA